LAKKLGLMHSPHFIAKKGLQILFKNKGQLVPGLLNKISLVLLKLVPNFVIRKILESRNR